MGFAALYLSYDYFWSRRSDDTHRLVYRVDGDDLVVIACRYHYA